MNNLSVLQSGHYYHIYNRANGKENLFRAEDDYNHFLKLYDKYIPPVSDTFAWVLMPNHFHFLVFIMEGMYYKYSADSSSLSSDADRSPAPTGANAVRFEDVKWETLKFSPPVNPSASKGPDGVNDKEKRKKANPTRHFSHLFNAYAKYVNEKYNRHGNLFQRPFKRKPVEYKDYLRQVVVYIHNNPVHHGFVNHPSEYPWSSYHSYLSSEPAKLQRETVLDWFQGIDNFKMVHNSTFDYRQLEKWFDLD